MILAWVCPYIKKVITIDCVNIILLHISMDDKPCPLHEHVPPVHLLTSHQHLYSIIAFGDSESCAKYAFSDTIDW